MIEKNTKIRFAEPVLKRTPHFEDSKGVGEAFLAGLNDRRGEVIITREASTEHAYLHRARNLLFTIERETGEATPTAIFQWLLAKSKEIAPSTLRQYRSALLFYMSTLGETIPVESRTDMANAIEAIRKIQTGGAITIKRTSSRKLRTIKERQLAYLIAELRTSPHKWDHIAADVFLASLATGLRPCEWEKAEIIEDGEDGYAGVTLLVQNAKNTNGRSTGQTRTLRIPNDAGAGFVRNVLAHLLTQSGKGISFKSFVEQTSRALTRTWKKISNKSQNVSLYTARHQFSANAKNLYSKAAVAILLGHCSEETAGFHYGKKRSGWPRYKLAGKISADRDVFSHPELLTKLPF